MNDFILVHIGKTGGSTVKLALRDNKILYSEIHTRKAFYNPDKQYIITLRNPIRRFISAFNWRYKLVCIDKTQEHRFDGEKEILELFGSVNNLAEKLYSQNGKLLIDLTKEEYYIHHLYEDINYHIGELVDNCKESNIAGIIIQETLNEDMEKIFGITTNRIENKNRDSDTYLSELAYNNLKKYLQKDYECIDKLYKMGVITELQYSLLSN